MSDTSQTIRSFQFRASLRERLEQMARELECSVDYLINDAMKQYARQRGYGGASVALSSSRSGQPSAASSIPAQAQQPAPAAAVPSYAPPAPPAPPAAYGAGAPP